MGYAKMLGELFLQTCPTDITIDQTVEFLELNGFYKNIYDVEMTQKILAAHKKQEARRFLGSIKDNNGQRLFANFKLDKRNFYTNINNSHVSKILLKAESALYNHIKGAQKHYRNVKDKRKRVQSAEKQLEGLGSDNKYRCKYRLAE